MKYNVQVSNRIASDIINAVDYYAEISEDLADDFIIEFQSTINKISSGPKHFQIVRGNTRKANFNRFPYGVFTL